MDIEQLKKPETLVNTSAGAITVKYPNTSLPLTAPEKDDQAIGKQLIITNCQIGDDKTAFSIERFNSLSREDQAAIAQALLNLMRCKLDAEADPITQVGAAAKRNAKERATCHAAAIAKTSLTSPTSVIDKLTRSAAAQATTGREQEPYFPKEYALNASNIGEERHQEHIGRLAEVVNSLEQIQKSTTESGEYQKRYNAKMARIAIASLIFSAAAIAISVMPIYFPPTAPSPTADNKAELSSNSEKSNNLTTADKSDKATGKTAASGAATSTASGAMPQAQPTAAASTNK